jgi:hypothetical protein
VQAPRQVNRRSNFAHHSACHVPHTTLEVVTDSTWHHASVATTLWKFDSLSGRCTRLCSPSSVRPPNRLVASGTAPRTGSARMALDRGPHRGAWPCGLARVPLKQLWRVDWWPCRHLNIQERRMTYEGWFERSTQAPTPATLGAESKVRPTFQNKAQA